MPMMFGRGYVEEHHMTYNSKRKDGRGHFLPSMAWLKTNRPDKMDTGWKD